MYRVSSFVQHFAFALLAGCGLATLWVNLMPESYYDFIEWRLIPLPWPLTTLGENLTVRDFAADMLMPLFVFYLGKELWEALRMKRGSLRGRRGGLPILAAAGGLVGAVLGWIVLSALFQTAEEAGPLTGWTMAMGSDVVLGYLFARAVFGPASPAVHILLLVTIAMDLVAQMMLGLIVLQAGWQLLWLALPVLAAVIVWRTHGRHVAETGNERAHQKALQLWPYILAAMISWLGVVASGLPPALGLLPVLPAIPHANHAFGMFAEAEELLTDPLNRLAHYLIRPLIGILFIFGLTHGGMDLSAAMPTTIILLGALWIGKPLGILVGALVVAPRFGYRLPQTMRRRDLVLIAGLAGIGFTIPALSLDAALPGGSMVEAARLGLAISLLAGFGTVFLARRLHQRRRY